MKDKQFAHPIKAVIFDLDGTLIDSEKIVLGAYHHVLTIHGEEYDEKTVRTYVGRTLEHSYAELVPSHDSKKLSIIHRDWQIKRKHLFQGYDGLEKLLKNLSNKGIKLGAYTSSSKLRTNAMFETIGINTYLDVVLCGDEVVNPKPHHEGVVTVAKKLNVKLEEVVMVGDAEHDILSGKNAGVITIGVTHGFGTKQSLQKAGADYLVNNLNELQNLLQKLTK